jgi:NAD(P)H-nitrite reductase large subunit
MNDKTICTCMGVTRQEIIDAINEKGCKTFEDIQRETQAGTVCGGCEGEINEILNELGN